MPGRRAAARGRCAPPRLRARAPVGAAGASAARARPRQAPRRTRARSCQAVSPSDAAVLLGKHSCAAGKTQLCGWENTAVRLGKHSCAAGKTQLCGWENSAALLGKHSCAAGKTQLCGWENTAALLGKHSCAAGKTQLRCWENSAVRLGKHSCAQLCFPFSAGSPSPRQNTRTTPHRQRGASTAPQSGAASPGVGEAVGAHGFTSSTGVPSIKSTPPSVSVPPAPHRSQRALRMDSSRVDEESSSMRVLIESCRGMGADRGRRGGGRA
jgi:hypothetical protein